MYHLGFLNKNCFRKFPFRQSSQMVDENGMEMPLSLIVGFKLTTLKEHLDIFISKIVIQNDVFSCEISSKVDDENIVIGYCRDKITQDYQSLFVHALNDTTGGVLIVGQREAVLQYNGVHIFSYENGKIEDSLIVPIQPPLVSRIVHGIKEASGRLLLNLDNILSTIKNNTIVLDVINKNLIISKNDKESARLNCSTNIITGINTVKPDASGNIDIYGIRPVRIRAASGPGEISVVTTSEEILVCPPSNTITPFIPENPNKYQGDILTATQPEWKTWPDYIKLTRNV